MKNNVIKELIASQDWIEGVKASKPAMAAFHLWHGLMAPGSIKKRIKRTAKDAGVPYDDVALMNLSYELSMAYLAGIPSMTDLYAALKDSRFPAEKWGCSCLGVVEEDRDIRTGPLHGRNLDWPDPGHLLRDNTEVIKEEGITPYYTVGFPGQAGVLTGSADHRFSISMNAVYTDKVGMGQAPVYLMREVLEKAKDFTQAVDMLSKTRLLVGALFMVVDGTMDAEKPSMVVVERTPDKYLVRSGQTYQSGNVGVICTNDYFGIKPKDAGTVPTGSELQITSCGRSAALEKELEETEGLFEEDTLLRAMKRNDVQLSCTIHTVIMDPGHAVKPKVYNP